MRMKNIMRMKNMLFDQELQCDAIIIKRINWTNHFLWYCYWSYLNLLGPSVMSHIQEDFEDD